MPALHQFVPTLDPGAVGTHLLEVQRALRAKGWDSEVFSEHTVAPYEGLARRFTDYGGAVAAHDDDVLVYHLAIGSSVADWLMDRRPPRLVVDYHNITPPEWFAGWEPTVAYGLAWGRAQLRRLAPRVGFGLADSAYNASELAGAGLRRAAVLPILLPDGRLLRGPECKIPPVSAPGEAHPLTPESVESWACAGWVDLRAPNMALWKDRFQRIEEEMGSIPAADTSSRFLRDRQFWGPEGHIQPGKVVGWIFAVEEKGARMK